MDMLYAELRALAHAHMRRERSEHTLQTSALINELYLRLIRQRHPRTETRAQFFGIAAHMMRRILVDYARSRAFQKRGSGRTPIPLDDAIVFSPQRSAELLALDEALDRLSSIDARKARVVELRYFGGMTATETANALRVSESTVMRDWEFARAWLSRELRT
jgi:RNA polymerase sigma-70 factor (ECF subfamily)